MLTDEQIRERDGWRCSRCGRSGDLDVHHRFPRSGGTDESAANRVSLCRFCHSWAHRHPADATEEGWIVRADTDPAVRQVDHWMWPAGPILLNGDGSVTIWQPG